MIKTGFYAVATRKEAGMSGRHAHACARVHDRAHTQGSQRQTVTWERVTWHARVTQSGRPWRSGRGRRLRAYSRVASNADFSGKRSIASTTACACRRNCGFCACTSETPGPRWMRTRCVEGFWCKILLPLRRKVQSAALCQQPSPHFQRCHRRRFDDKRTVCPVPSCIAQLNVKLQLRELDRQPKLEGSMKAD